MYTGIPRASLIILAGPPFKSFARCLPPKGLAKVYLYDKRCLSRPAAQAAADAAAPPGLFAPLLVGAKLPANAPLQFSYTHLDYLCLIVRVFVLSRVLSLSLSTRSARPLTENARTVCGAE